MLLFLSGLTEPIVATWRWEPPASGRPIALSTPIAARAFLARVDGSALAGLRRLVAEQLVAFQLDDAEILDHVARWVADGRLRLVSRPFELPSWGDGASEEPEVEAPPQKIAPLSLSLEVDAEPPLVLELRVEVDEPMNPS